MKIFAPIAILALFVLNAAAQPKPVTAEDYKATIDYAVSETNAAFPFIFTVVVDDLEEGKIVSSETTVMERQGAGVQRITRTHVTGGERSVTYQVSVGFGKVYCSGDGRNWQGPQKYECSGPTRLYGRKEVERAEYSVEERRRDGQKVKIYREYAVYKPSQGSSESESKETLATIDSRGFFVSVVNNEGTLAPEVVTLIRKQTWDFNTKFKPIVAPK